MSSYATTAFLILIYPTNLNMWINDIPFDGKRLTTTATIIRWIIQVMLLVVLLWLGEVIPPRRKQPPEET